MPVLLAGEPVDMWSLGVCVFEFSTGIPPFNDNTVELIFQHILNRDIPWPEPVDTLSPGLRQLLNDLLAMDAASRPTPTSKRTLALLLKRAARCIPPTPSLNGAAELRSCSGACSRASGLRVLPRILNTRLATHHHRHHTRLARSRPLGLRDYAFLEGVDWDNIRKQPAAFVPHPDDDTDTAYFTERAGCPSINIIVNDTSEA